MPTGIGRLSRLWTRLRWAITWGSRTLSRNRGVPSGHSHLPTGNGFRPSVVSTILEGFFIVTTEEADHQGSVIVLSSCHLVEVQGYPTIQMSEYVAFLEEVFAQFGPIHPRRMFGGYGLFHKGLMFGLVADDVLYLKAGETLAPFFEERGLEPFQYEKQGKTLKMSYYMAPEEIFEDPAEAKGWANRSYEAAVRAKKPVKKAKQRN